MNNTRAADGLTVITVHRSRQHPNAHADADGTDETQPTPSATPTPIQPLQFDVQISPDPVRPGETMQS